MEATTQPGIVGSMSEGGQLEMEHSVNQRRKAILIARIVLVIALSFFVVGFAFLQNTTLGFVLSYSGGILAVEAVILQLKAERQDSDE